jgi:hypothetical protein
VRQDGSSSQVDLSNCSTLGCKVAAVLPVGEIVSVEITDIALLVGQVSASGSGYSEVGFRGHVAH